VKANEEGKGARTEERTLLGRLKNAEPSTTGGDFKEAENFHHAEFKAVSSSSPRGTSLQRVFPGVRAPSAHKRKKWKEWEEKTGLVYCPAGLNSSGVSAGEKKLWGGECSFPDAGFRVPQ